MNKVWDKEPGENRDKVPGGNRGEMLISEVLAAIKSIRYGQVQITIHNSEVVQIDKTEKIRIPRPRAGIGN